MISIITAIYNQLDMNKMFYESVKQTTHSDWELIIIDNGSTDGSAEFFENVDPRVKVIRNDGNYSYPYCQNRGIDAARGDVLAFLNNDIWLPDGWDEKAMLVLGKDGYEVLTLCSNDNMKCSRQAKTLNRKYKRFKYPLLKLFGAKRWTLQLMLRLTYGNWEEFTDRIWKENGVETVAGFCGSAVLMTRRGLEILGKWDESQQAADFDLYYKSMERCMKYGDIKPLSLIAGIYHHHFSRLTFNAKFPPFRDSKNLKLLSQKWDDSTRAEFDKLRH